MRACGPGRSVRSRVRSRSNQQAEAQAASAEPRTRLARRWAVLGGHVRSDDRGPSIVFDSVQIQTPSGHAHSRHATRLQTETQRGSPRGSPASSQRYEPTLARRASSSFLGLALGIPTRSEQQSRVASHGKGEKKLLTDAVLGRAGEFNSRGPAKVWLHRVHAVAQKEISTHGMLSSPAHCSQVQRGAPSFTSCCRLAAMAQEKLDTGRTSIRGSTV
jgi:hypothetical protein